MISFLRTVPVMVAGFLLLGAAVPEGVQPSSPYRHYDSRHFIHGNFKPFFQKQWKDNALRVKCGRELTGALPSCPAPPVPLPLAVSSFRTGGHAPVMHKRLAEGVRELAPEERKELELALLQLLDGYARVQDDPQLKENLAGAFNHLFVSSYYALRHGQELTGTQRQSMLEQINAGIAMGLKERRLSDREKQELYESVVLSGSIILGLYNDGRDRGLPGLQKEARELARELLEQMMGISIDKVHVDDDGVRIE